MTSSWRMMGHTQFKDWSMMRSVGLATLAGLALLATGCATNEPLRAIDRKVDLPRFMGPWYVIAAIPIFLERGAHNGVESYKINPDGSIDTTYTFRKGSFDGPIKKFNPTGFVYNHDTNAEWRMQFIWPFKAAYLIIYLDEQYQRTIIGVPGRGNVWIMSRTPEIPDAEYQQLVAFLKASGHDVSKLERVPQRWPDPELTPKAPR
jgi:apolipoprotein D and lipocalin family protein